jgi:hypothetical protein
MNVHARVAPQNHKNRQTLNVNAIKKKKLMKAKRKSNKELPKQTAKTPYPVS